MGKLDFAGSDRGWDGCVGDGAACGHGASRLHAAAMLPALAHIDAWIFDLDNTLYPASANLFEHIDRRMTQFVGDLLGVDPAEAFRVQKEYFHAHGTTLAGLMAEHDVDPAAFLAYVHDIEMDVLEADAPLAAALAKLPGRKLVFTNGDKPYALKVLDRLGLGAHFEAVHDITAMGLVPKPQPSAYAGCARRSTSIRRARSSSRTWRAT